MQAEANVHNMAFQNGHIMETLPAKWTLKPTSPRPSGTSHGYSVLFSKQYFWGSTFPLLFMFLALNFAAQGTLLWLPEYMDFMGFDKKEVNLQYTLIAAAEVFAVIVAGLFVDSGKRTMTLSLSFLCSGVCLLGGMSDPENKAHFVVFIFGWAFWEELVWICAYVVAGEIYPSAIRNMASGFVMGPARVGGVFSSYIAGDLMKLNPGLPFVVNGLFLVTAALVAGLLQSDKTREPLTDQIEGDDDES